MTEEKLKKIIANQLGIESDSISLENKIVDDLGADSLDIVEIVMDVENSFSIKIEDAEYQDADTVQKIVDLINIKIEKK